MPDNFILLAREVERLVTAPYVASLQVRSSSATLTNNGLKEHLGFT